MLHRAPTARRAFSTTSRRLVGPESPAFIAVPTVKLPNPVPKRTPKGQLPAPKTVFLPSQPDKGSDEWLAAATPKRTRTRVPAENPEVHAFQKWHLAMANKRRQNLKEGLQELKKRKETTETKRKEVFKKRTEERNLALEKAEREDVRLTLPSVLSAMRIEEKVLPDPRRQERLAEMAEKVKAKEEKRVAERQHLIHELYINSSKFILTEMELDNAIMAEFKESTPDYLGRIQPPSMKDMLSQNERSGFAKPEDIGSVVLDVGGALTGGRMPADRNYINLNTLYNA
ncbi:hypothetical protein BZA77DRAFT_293036 [Pyronema omphalodes]|nr:hypothetical protein BZA77DRAFT_293036 [Pyronema omphalodes]